jgi:hypothetical protein
VPAPSFVLVALLAVGSALAADSTGYRKAYFGATKPGAWAQYTMRVEGQPDLRTRSTRLADANREQHLEARIDLKVQGKAEASFTEYTLQKGYSLENDALGFGKALVAVSTRREKTHPLPMDNETIAAMKKAMPDYAASARFTGTETIGGRQCDRYTYTNRYAGKPPQIETGELCLDPSVPFGLVYQKAVTKEESGKLVSSFDMRLVDSGTDPVRTAGATKKPSTAAPSAPAAPVARAAPAAPVMPAGPIAVGDAYKKGFVRLAVTVVDSTSGRNLRVVFRNKRDLPLKLAIPAGAITLDVDTPLDKLRLESPAAKTIEIAAGAASTPVEMLQGGQRRVTKGSFEVSVYEGTPIFSGNVTVDTVK